MQNNNIGYSMERFLYFSIGCLIVTAIFIHVHIIRTRKQYNIHIANQIDWMKTVSNEIRDIQGQLHSCYRIHDEDMENLHKDIEEIKKLIQPIIPKNAEPKQPKLHKENNWCSMKKAFCIPGTQVDDE